MKSKVLIIGLGLIGGSLAKTLRKIGFEIDAYDINNNYLEKAKKDGIISESIEDIKKIEDIYEFVFICVPVLESIKVLDKIKSDIKNSIITDVGSTKTLICKYAIENNISNFIGGHPMAGTEKIGYDNSFSSLFEGAYYFVTPIPQNRREDVEKLKKLLNMLNCRVEEIDYKFHDYIAGIISHLPHIVSAALVNVLNGDSILSKFAGGGFKDITRISSSSPKMWSDISFANKEIVVDLLDSYVNLLQSFKIDLIEDRYDNIYRYFERAKNIRDRIVSDKR